MVLALQWGQVPVPSTPAPDSTRSPHDRQSLAVANPVCRGDWDPSQLDLGPFPHSSRECGWRPDPEYFLYLSLILSFLHRMVEYSLDLQNINLSAIRTVRVLRPLKAINRVPSELDLPAHPSPPAQLAPLTYSEKTDWFLPGPELRSQCWTNVTLLPLNSWASLWYPEVLGRGS